MTATKKFLPAFLFGMLLLWQCAGPAAMDDMRNSSSLHSSFPYYRLGSGDEIEIKFFKNDQFSRTQIIRPDGYITLERVGDVLAAGLTPIQLDSSISAAYKAFVIDPEITVFITEFGSQKVFVFGDVQKPGILNISGEMSYLQAIASAGGPTDMAKLSSVMLIRKTGDKKEAAFKLNLRPGNHSEILQQFGYVKPNDIIYVPATALGSANKFMRQFYSTILPPIDVYVRALLWQ